jgi:hypothetical protein
MIRKDFIPKAYAELLQWLINFITAVGPYIERFGIAQEEYAFIKAAFLEYQIAYQSALGPTASKLDRDNRREKAIAVTKAVRQFINRFFRYNKNLTDIDRLKLGMRMIDKTVTPVSIPSGTPIITRFGLSENECIFLHYKDRDVLRSKAKPYGVHGVLIRWQISEKPPVDIQEFVHVSFSTRTPFKLTFQPHDRGKIVWFRLCWENNRGQHGPWSDLYSSIIP